MNSLVKFVQDEFVTRKDFPEFSAGDTMQSVSSQFTYLLYRKLKLTKEVKYVELEFSILEVLLVRKQELKKLEDNLTYITIKKLSNLRAFFSL